MMFGEELEVCTASFEPRTSASFFGTSYRELLLGHDGFLGFYDWLRDRTGKVVGFRLWIGAKSLELAKLIPQRLYLLWDSQDVFRVMFAACEDIDEDASMEQDFGHIRAFGSSDGVLLLAVDANGLDEQELASLMRVKGAE